MLEHFADPGAVLVVDETGDLKKGTMTVGTQRQYTGTAGRTENAQVAVYLAYAAPAGSAFIDRALYLPRSWTCDPARCRAAGVPQDTAFATKPALAKEMIGRALDAGTPAAWVTADEVYGQDPQLRAELARRGLGYVLAVAKSHPVTTAIGPRPAIELARRLPARAWQRLSAGPGAKGPRWYDWALIEVTDPAVTERRRPALAADPPPDQRRRVRLLPRPRPRPGAIGPAGAGSRVPVEGRGRVRRRKGTGRPGRAPGPQLDLLAPLDHPGPARPRVPVRPGRRPALPRDHAPEDQLIPLTRNEIRRLFTGLCQQPPAPRIAAALVPMATPTSGHRPRLPLPPTSPRTQHDYEVSLEY